MRRSTLKSSRALTWRTIKKAKSSYFYCNFSGDLTPEKVPTCIVDYSSQEQSDAQLETELDRADVVCIVYSVDDEDSLDSVTDHWLPLLRVTLGENHTTPVILVGNKVYFFLII